ncbi:hypothetical protein SMICM17S_10365 [Streptomyces microflavus]
MVSRAAQGTAKGPSTKTTRTTGHQGTRGRRREHTLVARVSAAGKNKDGHPRSYEIVPGATSKYPGT